MQDLLFSTSSSPYSLCLATLRNLQKYKIKILKRNNKQHNKAQVVFLLQANIKSIKNRRLMPMLLTIL